jgi:hypothetical protein
MWMSEVEMKVWMRGRCESLIAPSGVDVGLVGAGEAADHRALDAARDRLDRLEVAGRGDREAGLDHVDAQPRELLGDLDLLAVFSEMPGDCSPSRRWCRRCGRGLRRMRVPSDLLLL